MTDDEQKELVLKVGDRTYVEDKSMEKVEVRDEIIYINKFFRKEMKLENITVRILV